MDTDKARPSVGPDLGPNCLQRLSADNTSRQRVKKLKYHFRSVKCTMTCSNTHFCAVNMNARYQILIFSQSSRAVSVFNKDSLCGRTAVNPDQLALSEAS